MTTDFVALAPQLTVERAIDEVRRIAEEKETINDIYVVDPNGTLLGSLSLRALVLGRAGHPLSAVMDPDVVSVQPEMHQEDVARLFQHYDLLAMPVVDQSRKLLGIVTIDDVVAVLKQEQAEDIQKLGAVGPTEEGYFETDFWTFVRKRGADRHLPRRDLDRQCARALRGHPQGLHRDRGVRATHHLVGGQHGLAGLVAGDPGARPRRDRGQ